jgi:hypothetical protein
MNCGSSKVRVKGPEIHLTGYYSKNNSLVPGPFFFSLAD